MYDPLTGLSWERLYSLTDADMAAEFFQDVIDGVTSRIVPAAIS